MPSKLGKCFYSDCGNFNIAKSELIPQKLTIHTVKQDRNHLHPFVQPNTRFYHSDYYYLLQPLHFFALTSIPDPLSLIRSPKGPPNFYLPSKMVFGKCKSRHCVSLMISSVSFSLKIKGKFLTCPLILLCV
jgi:hypothetical protein